MLAAIVKRIGELDLLWLPLDRGDGFFTTYNTWTIFITGISIRDFDTNTGKLGTWKIIYHFVIDENGKNIFEEVSETLEPFYNGIVEQVLARGRERREDSLKRFLDDKST